MIMAGVVSGEFVSCRKSTYIIWYVQIMRRFYFFYGLIPVFFGDMIKNSYLCPDEMVRVILKLFMEHKAYRVIGRMIGWRSVDGDLRSVGQSYRTGIPCFFFVFLRSGSSASVDADGIADTKNGRRLTVSGFPMRRPNAHRRLRDSRSGWRAYVDSFSGMQTEDRVLGAMPGISQREDRLQGMYPAIFQT
jgi:hypothetical protein